MSAAAAAYRPEIDGLRAVAVLSVIAFHAGIEHMAGGFVGVDVFFVISGYLISRIIFDELDRGTFTIAGFYERRARRILPALLLVVLVTLPLAWLWMLPAQFSAFADSLVAVALFASNILFWSESGYFAPAAELKPLLHTWSLAVEEQFYLLFPLLLIACRGARRVWLPRIVMLIFVASLAVAELGRSTASNAVFYLTPARVWELMLGVLIVLGADLPARVGDRTADGLAAIGLAAIAIAVFIFDAASGVPGLAGLIPTGGAALVIAFARPGGAVARLLSHRAVVFLGLLSYSAYLWHQPLFALARLRLGPEAEGAVLAVLAVASIVLAWLSWRFVERPFRDRRRFSRRAVLRGAATVSVLLAGLGIGLASVPEATLAKAAELDQARLERLERSALEHCRPAGEVPRPLAACGIGAPDGPSRIVVVGDSQARSIQAGLHAVLETMGVAGIYFGAGSTLPLPSALQYDDGFETAAAVAYENVFERIEAERPSVVLLQARWDLLYEVDRSPTDARRTPRYTALSTDDPLNRETSRSALRTALTADVARLASAGGTVFLLSAIPTLPHGVRRCYLDRACSEIDAAPLRRRNEGADAMLADVAAAHPNVFHVELLGLLCPEDACLIETGDRMLYRDPAHLTVEGAEWLADELLRSRLSMALQAAGAQ